MVFALYRKKGYLYRLPFTADFFLPLAVYRGERRTGVCMLGTLSPVFEDSDGIII